MFNKQRMTDGARGDIPKKIQGKVHTTSRKELSQRGGEKALVFCKTRKSRGLGKRREKKRRIGRLEKSVQP